MSISHFLPSGVLNFSESHCFCCQMNPRVGDIRKVTVWSCIHAQVLIVIIKKGLYSGSLFFLDVFLFCRQSFITEQLHFLWRLFFFVNMPIFDKWQKKLECLLNDTVLKLNRLPMIHVSFYSTVRYFCVTFHSEMNWEFLKAALCCFSIWKWWSLVVFVLFACNRERAAPPLAWHRTVALLACPATHLTLNTAASTLAWLTGSLACLRMFAVAEMPKKLKTSVVQGCNEKNCHDRLAHQSVVQILFWYWAHNSYSPIPTVLPVASLKKKHT